MIDWVGPRLRFPSQAAGVEPSWFLLHQLLFKTQLIPAKQNPDLLGPSATEKTYLPNDQSTMTQYSPKDMRAVQNPNEEG